MAKRTFAIGDVHGCLDALVELIHAINPQANDTIITLGDYVDRGPNSSDVLEFLISLSHHCTLIPILGNHEEMMLCAINDVSNLKRWLTAGGSETLLSYGWKAGTSRRSLADWIPEHHRAFLANCHAYHETSTHLFLHAGYDPDLPMEQQTGEALRWRVTNPSTVQPHCSGKIAIVGHTPQFSGKVLDLGFLKCIDTNCVRGGCLTAIEVETGNILTDR